MKNWWRKSLVVAVAVLSLGTIPPTHTIWENLLEEKTELKSHADKSRNTQITYDWQDTSEFYFSIPTILDTVHETAEQQAYMKFGSRIGPVIEDEFKTAILPNIQEAIDFHLAEVDSTSLRKLAISQKPSGDYSEKIFHIYDSETNKDKIRFHVRTEKKPQEGYYFNFHYHLEEDDFQQHITLGDIYWSKDTPPKWLS